jgi:signal transduction histidine kinase
VTDSSPSAPRKGRRPAEPQHGLRFTVDTHILRELGSLLVGRDSTALLELVKNAYDADATDVWLYGADLDGPGGVVAVLDNGNGMTQEDFRTKFLRIAGRTKEQEPRSPALRRRVTGAKGIGRLSTHKLGGELLLHSRTAGTGDLSARIDWDLVESHDDLLEAMSDAIQAGPLASPVKSAFWATAAHSTFQQRLPLPDADPDDDDSGTVWPPPDLHAGTELVIRRLRTTLTPAQRSALVGQMRAARPWPALLRPPASPRLGGRPLLLERLRLADTSDADPGMRLHLGGDFAAGEDLYRRVVDEAEWLLEIDARGQTVRFAVTPMRTYLSAVRDRVEIADRFDFERPHPSPDSPRFQARVYVTTGGFGKRTDPFSRFAQEAGGIRVYMEGFRVLPYGARGDDWLGLDRDVARRPRGLDVPLSQEDANAPADEREGFYHVGAGSYFGAVFLTQDDSGGLQMLVNREGFLPDDAYLALRDIVRNGVDLCTRVRASVGRRLKEEQRQREREEQQAKARSRALFDEQGNPKPDDGPDDTGTGGWRDSTRSDFGDDNPPGATVRDPVQEAADLLARIGRPGPERTLSTEDLRDAARAGASLSAAAEDLRDEQAMLRVLASVGTQLGAFLHEIQGLVGQAQTVRRSLTLFLERVGETASAKDRALAGRLRGDLDGVVQAIERQAAYLGDVVSADARRRRSPQPVEQRFRSAFAPLAGQAELRRQTVDVDVPSSLRTPPMFPAELSALATNLLSNAVKFAGDQGRIRVTGGSDREFVEIKIQNTGAAVDLADAEKWFRPFESTTADVDPVLGQGMGLGLPLSRRIAADYGGTLVFIEPDRGFATALLLSLRKPTPEKAT